MKRLILFGILLAQFGGSPQGLGGTPQMRPYAPQGMPGQVPLNQIVPQMGNPHPLGSAGNPVVSGPPRPWGSAVPLQPMRPGWQ